MKRYHLAGAAVLAVGALLPSCRHASSFRPPEREGPPALVQQEKEPRFWLLLKQEEQRTERVGSYASSQAETASYYHFDLQAHDPATAGRLWKKRLRTVREEAGGRTTQARILGQDGEVVWLFLDDGPVALSSKDASQLADRATIEQRNPALHDLIPKELNFYAYDGGLVLIAADARRFRIRAGDFVAEPYTAPNESYFRDVHSRSTVWDGSYATRDFLVRQMMLNGRWIGFFTAAEAEDAGKDDFGRKLATGEPGSKPEEPIYHWQQARRTFWSARIGKTKEFPEGTHDRLFDVTRIPDAPEFLEAGLLIQQGTKRALRLHDPDGFLVLHRTRLGEEGRLGLTRLDDNFKTKWTATLPLHELHNRYESPGHLLLFGSVQQTNGAVTGGSEHLVALNLADGKTQSWNVNAEKAD
ncbi:MAG: hypothetical protein H0X40_17410 [Chthoniobacterales bacterium]|nr:hypothetical protein [Chthoniobacterales bacterium]